LGQHPPRFGPVSEPCLPKALLMMQAAKTAVWLQVASGFNEAVQNNWIVGMQARTAVPTLGTSFRRYWHALPKHEALHKVA
jgi:hypothetical protein